MSRARPRRAGVARALGCTAVLALAASGCGGGDAGEEPPRSSAGASEQASGIEPRPLGVRMAKADCRDWRRASEEEREAAIRTLEEIAAGETDYGPATTLPPEQAYSALEGRCSQGFADGFLLYLIYVQAAGFSSYAE